MKIFLSIILLLSSFTSYAEDGHKLNLPQRAANALTGSAFIKKIMNLGPAHREAAILKEILRGNVPDFIRTMTPLESKMASGPQAGQTLKYWVLPDYLAVGSDSDYVRVPLNMYTIEKLKDKLHVSLPTAKMVDEIYSKAKVHVSPRPIPNKENITCTNNILKHNEMVINQTRDYAPGTLIAGHKKDIVQSRRLVKRPGSIAIYGWHRNQQDPIQPLSTVHAAEYADYSHGIRLVSNEVEINGSKVDLRDLLESNSYASNLSSEGVIPQKNHGIRATGTMLSVARHP